ncbi:Thioesterase/thiol ester dehydrase-isomerase [Xylariaceae sp. FL1019]|nr:Thioesterase/thiol ester dehydrase-isomerase [Xylariaceae sp. FL1019]
MTSPAPVEARITVVPAPDLGEDVFTHKYPLKGQEGVRSVFGGFLVGQAVSAANATVGSGFEAHASQSSFIRPAKADVQHNVTYWVERTADSRTFATRLVHGRQGGELVYIATISFRNTSIPAGPILQYQVSPPVVDVTPDDIPRQQVDRFNASIIDKSVPLLQVQSDEMPFDWRFVGLEMSDKATDVRLRTFVRSPPLSSREPSVHLAALAYLSDEFSFGIAVAANPRAVGQGMRNVALATSLTHTVSFHDSEFKADDWLIVERETSWGDEGRVLVYQRMWNVETGKLIMSGIQEALVRLKEVNRL